MKAIQRLALMAVAIAGMAGVAHAGQPAPEAKISMDQARAIAMKVAQGTIVDSEYEKEDGAWRYSFEIRQDGRIHEIGVDANTGAIVEDSWENADGHD